MTRTKQQRAAPDLLAVFSLIDKGGGRITETELRYQARKRRWDDEAAVEAAFELAGEGRVELSFRAVAQ